MVITDISVFRFYGYIENILTDILTQNINKLKINQKSWKCKNKKTVKNELEV